MGSNVSTKHSPEKNPSRKWKTWFDYSSIRDQESRHTATYKRNTSTINSGKKKTGCKTNRLIMTGFHKQLHFKLTGIWNTKRIQASLRKSRSKNAAISPEIDRDNTKNRRARTEIENNQKLPTGRENNINKRNSTLTRWRQNADWQ